MRVKKCKAALALALAIALAAPAAAASTPVTTAQAAAKVKLSAAKKTLNVGKSFTLKLKNAGGKVTWKSSKKSVATVNAKGKVNAIASGTTTITATNKKKAYKCKVTVKNPKKPAGMKDMQAGPVNLCYPKAFTAEAAEVDGNYAWVAADAEDAEKMTQTLTVKMQYTGEDAYDYDTLLGMYEAQLSEEAQKSVYEMLGIEAEITNYEMASYDSKAGKAVRVAFHLKMEMDGEKVEVDEIAYLVGIKNYIIQVNAEALNGGKIDVVDGYAKTLLDTMTVL